MAPASPVHDDASIMRKPAISYVDCSVPEHMTIAEYRRARPRRAPKRGLRRFLGVAPAV